MTNFQQNDKVQQVAISRRKIVGEARVVINEIAERCLYTGFFGTLDSARMKKIMDGIMEVTGQNDNDLLIVDLSNVDVIDSAIAEQLIELDKFLKLIGVEVFFCGIKPGVAQAMVSSGVELASISVYKNLRRALEQVYRKLGLQLVPLCPKP